MKRTLLSSFMILLVLQASAQRFQPVKEDLPAYREIHTIKPESPDREGRYMRLPRWQGDTLVCGNYQQGKKIGPWTYYGTGGEVLLHYHYDKGEVIRFGAPGKVSVAVVKGGDVMADTVDLPPLYLGYQDEVRHILDRHLEVPEACMRKGLSGTSMATFTVDEEGSMQDIRVEKVIHPSLITPLEQALKQLRGHWLPAEKNGGPVASRISVIVDIQFFEEDQPDYRGQFVEKPGVYVVEKIFIPKTAHFKG